MFLHFPLVQVARALPLSNLKRPTAGVARRSAAGFEKHTPGAGRTEAVGSSVQPDLCSFAAGLAHWQPAPTTRPLLATTHCAGE
jgi:hypothetical protein